MIATIAGYLVAALALLGLSAPAPQPTLGAALKLSTVATSTFPDGIDINAGCFAKSGTCLSLSSLSGTLGATNGGTGQSTVTQGDLLYGSAANTWSKLAKDTNSTRYLSNTGVSNNPAWAQVALATGVSGDLPFANLTQGSALSVLANATNGTADFASLAAGSDNQVLRRSGTAIAWGAINLASSNAVTGLLANTNGGTGVDSSGFTGVAVVNSGTWSASTTLGVPRGGTGAATFGQGWIFSAGGTGALSASTSPTVNYITATSTTASSTFQGITGSAFNMTGAATSTASNGINITAGCFAKSGTCIGGSTPTITTFMPPPMDFTINPAFTTLPYSASTTIRFNMFHLPAQMTVNNIFLRVTAVTTSGTVNIAVFSEDGQTRHINVVSPTISATGRATTTVSAVTLPAGNYYIATQPVSTTNVTVDAYDDTLPSTQWFNPFGQPVYSGRKTGQTGGTMVSTFDPTTITPTFQDMPVFRLDN